MQTTAPLYSRVTFELGSLLLQLRRGREALEQLEECLVLFKDRKSEDGHARSLAAFMQALQLVGDAPRSEQARKQQAEIADSVKFATLSRKTQLAVLQSLGSDAPKMGERTEEAEEDEEEREDFESFPSTFYEIVEAVRVSSAEPVRSAAAQSPPPVRSPVVSPRAAAVVAERTRGRRASVVDLFAPPAAGSPNLNTSSGALPSPRAAPGTPLSPRASPRPEKPLPPERVVLPPPPQRDDSETMKVALRQLRKDILPKDESEAVAVAPPPRDDSESMRVVLTALRPSVAKHGLFACPNCGTTTNVAGGRACAACGHYVSQ